MCLCVHPFVYCLRKVPVVAKRDLNIASSRESPELARDSPGELSAFEERKRAAVDHDGNISG